MYTGNKLQGYIRTFVTCTSFESEIINVSSNATSCDLLNEVFAMKTNIKYIFIWAYAIESFQFQTWKAGNEKCAEF